MYKNSHQNTAALWVLTVQKKRNSIVKNKIKSTKLPGDLFYTLIGQMIRYKHADKKKITLNRGDLNKIKSQLKKKH